MGGLTTLAEALPGCRHDLPRDRAVARVSDVHVSFAGVHALRGVSFDVRPDELLAVIGPNGAGKSTLFNVLSGVYRPERGRIELFGRDMTGEHPAAVAAAGVGRMFQSIALFEHLSVLDNLMLGRHLRVRYGLLAAAVWVGRARREELRHREVVEEIVEFLEIERFRKSPVGLLPYGVKKRVELGRALAMEPKLLLLDEPVAGMNLEETQDMARFIVDIRTELAVPVVLVEHDMGVVMDLADRVLVLDFGAQVACDTPAAVQRDANVLRAYLGVEHASAGEAA